MAILSVVSWFLSSWSKRSLLYRVLRKHIHRKFHFYVFINVSSYSSNSISFPPVFPLIVGFILSVVVVVWLILDSLHFCFGQAQFYLLVKVLPVLAVPSPMVGDVMPPHHSCRCCFLLGFVLRHAWQCSVLTSDSALRGHSCWYSGSYIRCWGLVPVPAMCKACSLPAILYLCPPLPKSQLLT